MLTDNEASTRAGTEPSLHWATVESPIGEILLIADETALRELRLPGTFADRVLDGAESGGARPLADAIEQLEAYFAGELARFDLALVPIGTPFQRRVWCALADIPYAGTESYGSVAARVGNPKASRAVGMANNRNPIPIVLPCHRVIGASGKLVGYGGGLWMKEWLLQHEVKVAARRGSSPD